MGERNGETRKTLVYIQSMLRELRQLANSERAEMAAYLIDMAYLEVSDILRGQRPIREGFGEAAKPSLTKAA